MIKKYSVFIKHHMLENNSIDNAVMPFSESCLCKINICCPAGLFRLSIGGGGFCNSINFFYTIILLLHLSKTSYLNKSIINLFFNFIYSNSIVYFSYFYLNFHFFKKNYLSLRIFLYVILASYTKIYINGNKLWQR